MNSLWNCTKRLYRVNRALFSPLTPENITRRREYYNGVSLSFHPRSHPKRPRENLMVDLD